MALLSKFVLFLMLAGGAAASAGGAELKPLLDPDDLPPDTAAAVSLTLTHSQQETERSIGALKLDLASTNIQERAATRALIDLHQQLRRAEAKAYFEDPALLVSDSYQEKAHEWVTHQHNAEFNASLNFLRGSTSKEMRGIIDLIDMILFRELASDPRWRPLFASVYDAVNRMVETNKTIGKGFQHLYDFSRNDQAIGYSANNARPAVSSLDEYLQQLDKRYPRLLAKLEDLKKAARIPADAFAGIKYGELYRLLDGLAQIAVELRTPPEVSDLRQKFRRKVVELANLRAKSQPNKAGEPPRP